VFYHLYWYIISINHSIIIIIINICSFSKVIIVIIIIIIMGIVIIIIKGKVACQIYVGCQKYNEVRISGQAEARRTVNIDVQIVA